MKIDSKDLIRIIATVGAFIMFAIGALMMWKGISAEGSIDLKSTVLSGSIETGSAGLFISFLSFFIIVVVILTVGQKQVKQGAKIQSKVSKAMPVFWALLLASIVSVTLAATGLGSAFAFISGVLGFFLFMVVVAILCFIEDE